MTLTVTRAAFLGSRIILRQCSPEAESIYDYIIALHEHCDGAWAQIANEANVSEEDLYSFLQYAAQFLGNLGNYKGFGDVKFIPRCSPQILQNLTSRTSRSSDHAVKLLEKCLPAMYANESQPALMHFGFPGQGHMSNYYPDSSDITQAEIEQIGDFVVKKGLLPENTRIRKTKNGDYEILIASALSKPPSSGNDTGEQTSWDLEGSFSGKKVSLVFGDHQEEMAKIALEIKKAGQHAANPTQKKMMDEYALSFGTGSLNSFKESQKLWVKDTRPEVECNIGFIETYRDPAGIRGEWEGFAAIVNVERTKAFQKLVEAAPAMIPKLPWSSDFEKDKFTPPDFTSLEVLSFAASGIPAG